MGRNEGFEKGTDEGDPSGTGSPVPAGLGPKTWCHRDVDKTRTGRYGGVKSIQVEEE